MHPLPGEAGKEKKVAFSGSRIFFFAIPLVFAADRALKIFVMARFAKEGQGISLIPDILYLTRVNNTGGAFGLFKGSRVFLVTVSLIFLLGLMPYLWRIGRRPAEKANILAWALVIGGALGNLYDRLAYGYVVDFLDLRVWPVFNLADSFVCIGVFLAAWQNLKKNK